jgi:hypothetical protein
MAARGTFAGLGAILAFLLMCAGLIWSGTAQAQGEPAFGCGHEHRGKSAKGGAKAPLAIGDSTMLLPIPDLTKAGFNVNAKGCRGFRQSVVVMQQYAKRGKLPHMVVLGAYSNGGVNPGLIDFALETAGPSRVLVLLTQYDADTGEPPAADTGVLYKAAKRHPRQIAVLDWVDHSLPHHSDQAPEGWFLPDLFHPNFTGAQEFTDFLAGSLRYAKRGKFPGRSAMAAAAAVWS